MVKDKERRTRAHILVSGRVQGVFFRANCVRVASSLGLDGWVKNVPHGDVEILVEGDEREIKKLIGWCHSGPRNARIEKVDVEWSEPRRDHARFRAIYE